MTLIELRETHNFKLKDLLKVAGVAKSVYHYWSHRRDESENKDADMVSEIEQVITEHKSRVGYRRITHALKEKGWHINHKRVLRLMRENDLLCNKFNRKSRKYNAYKGTVGKIAKNRLNRRFKTDRPYQKWVTDITEFKIPGSDKKLYLSPIMDLYSLEILTYAISDSPTYDIVHAPLKAALEQRPKGLPYRLTVHSDQGWHYQMKQWRRKLKAFKAFQSMSRKGNCLDNSPMENFFGLLKQEMFFGEQFHSYEALKAEIETYIEYYNHHRIKLKLKGMSPVKYRQHTYPEAA